MFGLSDETPVLQNVMCNGSEYSLSYCEGYKPNNISGDYCLSGKYQAGVRCIEGMTILIKNVARISEQNLLYPSPTPLLIRAVKALLQVNYSIRVLLNSIIPVVYEKNGVCFLDWLVS